MIKHALFVRLEAKSGKEKELAQFLQAGLGMAQQEGTRLDEDVAPAKDVRIVQFTPPGSGCSVDFGIGVTASAPGTAVGALVVSDISAAHEEVTRRGIGASDMWHGAPFPPEARLPGPDPKRTSYGSFFAFSDPDGNAWLVQEVTTRRPGRI